LLLAVLGGSQLGLPRLAERRVRSQLADVGEVRQVTVRALPAFKLLANRADRVDVRLGAARVGTGELGALLERARGADELTGSATSLELGPLALRDARLRKRGDALEVSALLTDAALRAATPAGIGLRPVATTGGELAFDATAGLLGLSATVRARLGVSDGALVVAPDGALGALATVTLFQDPRVTVTGAQARVAPDGYAVRATAQLSR